MATMGKCGFLGRLLSTEWSPNSLQSPLASPCPLTSAGAIPPDKPRGAGTPGIRPRSLRHSAEGEPRVRAAPQAAAGPQPAQEGVPGGAACGPPSCPCSTALALRQQDHAGGAQALVGAPQVAALEGARWRKLQALVNV